MPCHSCVLLLTLALGTTGDDPRGASRPSTFESMDLDPSADPMRALIERHDDDLRSLLRFHSVELSPRRRTRLERFEREWSDRLDAIDFNALGRDAQVDWLLLRNQLKQSLRTLERDAERDAEIADLVPFADAIAALAEARQRVDPIEPKAVAARLDKLKGEVEAARKAIEERARSQRRPAEPTGTNELPRRAFADDEPARIKPTVANRAAGAVGDLRRSLRNWFEFYNGYDPLFTWWGEAPYKALDQALESHGRFLRERVAGVRQDDRNTIIGDPVGSAALRDALDAEQIPYTPEELIAIGEREMAWCEAELKKAANELGFGDDWKAALEHVKRQHVEPGQQPKLVRELAQEAIDFVERRDLLTVPPLAREVWRMEMMSPEAQLRNPFFLGGESIIVAFPTNTMEHDAKMMSLRGNNIHFARATVHHELIPGHNLQAFMTARYRPYRRTFGTPFWTEGWALYWELRLWELGFPRSPEDRIGMLFWRMHRGARIVFSLKFHLEQMTPQECIDLLVDRVGHERANAEAEVRRSFQGGYGPLYQCAYLLGGVQFRGLHRELVASGKMTERAFHDAILRLGSMPVRMVRASLTDEPLARDGLEPWRFDSGAE
jgi:uncharacterized protein (DUF885 family)